RTPGAKVDRCGPYFPFAGSDDLGLCDSEPFRMVDVFARTGWTKLEDGSRHRAHHDRRLRYRIAVWTQRCRACLLGGDVAVGHSGYCVGCARYSVFLPRYFAGCEPAAGFKHRGRRVRYWSTNSLRPILVSIAQTCARNYRSSSHVPWNALVRHRTEITIPGSPSRIERAFV